MRLVPALVLPGLFAAACAHNPARPITVNDEEVQVHEEAAEVPGETPGAKPILFTRAAEPLDEQEFYASISDTASYEAVKSSRTRASFLQGTGVAMAVVGFLAAAAGLAAYFLSDSSKFTPPPIPVPEDMRTVPIYGGIAGGVLGAGGIALIGAMAGKVRGDKLVFDLAHARRSLEVNLYGENGATPDDVKSLTFGEGDEGKRICAAGELALAPLVAKDAKGRKLRVTERADWFTWTTTPRPGLVARSPDAPVLTSPLAAGLADVDAEVGLSIAVTGTPVGHSMTFDQSFACSTGVSRDGRPGTSGTPGGHGKSGGKGASGGQGGDGVDGAAGGDGPTVVAEVTWVSTPKRGRLALLVVDGEARLFDPSQTSASVTAAGGTGGEGGRGGQGGSGGNGAGHACQSGGNGGTGGRGGRGGTGGRGGRVVIRATDRSLLDAVEGSAPGGGGGSGGRAGSGGAKGSGSACKKGWAPNGTTGTPGSEGAPGGGGADGTVEKELASMASMRSLGAVLAANPQLQVEEGAFAGPAPRPSRKRR